MILFASMHTYAQSNNVIPTKNSIGNIEGLTIFPNPVKNGKVYIYTKNNHVKDIEVFDVLGKKVISQVLYSKELNVQKLKSGIYLLKIKEGKYYSIRKLIVR